MFLRSCLIAEERRGKKVKGTIFLDPSNSFLPSFFLTTIMQSALAVAAAAASHLRVRIRPIGYIRILFVAVSLAPFFTVNIGKNKVYVRLWLPPPPPPAGRCASTHTQSVMNKSAIFVYRVALAEAANSSSREVRDRINNLMDDEALEHHAAHTTRIDVFCLMRNRRRSCPMNHRYRMGGRGFWYARNQCSFNLFDFWPFFLFFGFCRTGSGSWPAAAATVTQLRLSWTAIFVVDGCFCVRDNCLRTTTTTTTAALTLDLDQSAKRSRRCPSTGRRFSAICELQIGNWIESP